jgi:hypothetical protein
LLGLGRSLSHRVCESGPAVASNDLDTRAFFQPLLQSHSISSRQDVDDAVPFEIDQDRAVVLPLAGGPIIDADVTGGW